MSKDLMSQRVSAEARSNLLVATRTAFTDAKLRKAEAKAQDAFIKALNALPRIFTASDMATFRKCGLVADVTKIRLPQWVHTVVDTVEHKVSEEKTVTRHVRKSIYAPTWLPVEFIEWSKRNIQPKRRDEIELAKAIRIPLVRDRFALLLSASGRGAPDTDAATHIDHNLVCPLPKRLIETLDAWYKAGELRFTTEQKIADAMQRIIKAARKNREIVDVWPAARTTIEQTTIPAIEKGKALLVLSPEDKALVCGWMKDNKQKSTACSATVPA